MTPLSAFGVRGGVGGCIRATHVMVVSSHAVRIEADMETVGEGIPVATTVVGVDVVVDEEVVKDEAEERSELEETPLAAVDEVLE